MKKILSLFIFTLTFIGLANAQTEVTGGTSQNLTAVHTHGSTFAWTVVGDGGTTVTIAETTSAVTFTWPTVADMYTISVVTTDVNGCKSEPFEQRVKVLGTPTVEFADATDITGVCPVASTIDDNGSSTIIVNYTGAKPWKLTYSILDEDGNVHNGIDNKEEDAIANANFSIDIPHDFENTLSTSKKWRVVINSAESADGVVATATTAERLLIVNPKPVITNLSFN